ncbi:prolipoprotein diacylglyceryl transferase [Mesoterricola sediminis]|uniref:Phosphatidylglycerol--prolipoprotein diacylglyceryl transferase n=1 Tax=Mesoterricola sediminis TaxID=2927980 RepID=A0AA48KF06_9BACT|nr:prolipoprotein diacylglyceryl transferase [Mesoterricola sediminis]BDU77827.1 prolipoprotein diacylglyceryl transferase [Mesoterricola sediminis]
MHPILFKLGTFPVGTYGLILTVGFFLALYLAQALAKRDGISAEAVSDLAITLLLAGILGAKLLMIVVDLSSGTPVRQILDPAYLRAGGAIHGGVIGGVVAFFWRMRKLKLPLGPTLDALTPAVALGQAIGRLGCFSAGCCYGTECHLPWAVTFTNPDAHWLSGTPLNLPIHPVQLYTLLANALVMALLLATRGRRRFAGQVGALYFVLEGVGRIVTETWRADLDRGFLLNIPWLSTGRATALAFIAFGLILWVLFRRRHAAEAAA